MANRQPHLLVFIGMVCIFLLPQCAKDKKNTTIKKTGPAKIVRRRSKNEPRAREITRGLQTFKEVAAEDKRYKADDYEAKGPAWYRGMSFEELKKRSLEYEKAGRWDLVVKFLDRIIKLSNDQLEIRNMRLQMADALYEWQEYDRASRLYVYFAELYPGSKQSEYASYKSILSLSKMILEADRDTSAARAVAREGRDFLRRKAAGNTAYNTEVEDLIHAAIKRIYESELLTFYFYLNSGHYTSAVGRLEFIKKEFVADLPDIGPEIIVLEFELAAARDDKELQQKKKKELKIKYPAYTSTVVEKQEKKSKKKDHVKTF